MRQLDTFIAGLVLISTLSPVLVAHAQSPVSVIGPVTPGNCVEFNSTTIIKDAGAVCSAGSGGGGFAADKRVYVSTQGNDANNGFSPSQAKLTLQAGVNTANPGGIVYVGAGTYTLTSNLTMQPGVRMLCDATATIMQGNSAALGPMISFNAANNGSIRGCTIDGNRSNNADTANYFCIYIGAGNDVTVDSNIIQNCPGYGIDVSTGLRPIITNNSITNVFEEGISIITSTPQETTDAKILNNILTTPLGQHPISLVNTDNNLISGNRIIATQIGGAGSGTPLSVNTSGTAVTWVSGPTFTNIFPGMFMLANSGSEYFISAVNSSTSITLSTSAGTHSGIPAIMGEGDLFGIDSSSRNVITQNFLQNGATGGIVVSNETGGESTVGNMIANNTVLNTGETCISTQGVSNGTQVFDNVYSNNNVTNCGQGTAAGIGASFTAGFNFIGPALSSMTVEGNYSRDNQGSPTMNQWMAVSSIADNGISVGYNSARGMINTGIGGAINNFVLSAGWGSGASTSAATSNGHSFTFTVTAGTGATLNPGLEVHSAVAAMPNFAVPVCKLVAGTGLTSTLSLFGEENSTPGVTIIFIFQTPGAGSTYAMECVN